MPARHSSIGRDIIRGIDVEHDTRGLHTDTTTESSRSHSTEIVPRSEGALAQSRLRTRPRESHSIATDPTERNTARDVSIDLEEAGIDSIVTSRVHHANATVDFLVKRANGNQSWEPEQSLQEQAPALVYKYWDAMGGRDVTTGLDMYHVFRVLEESPLRRDQKYLVQWVGFDPSESTWEHQRKLERIAPNELARFKDESDSRCRREKAR